MAKNVRFGEYLQAVTVDTASVAYGKLLPKPQFDAQGREIPQKVTKLNMSGADIATSAENHRAMGWRPLDPTAWSAAATHAFAA